MRVAYLIILLYLTLPFAGLYTISDAVLNVYNLNIKSVYELRQAYPIYLACFAFAFILPFVTQLGQPKEVTSPPLSEGNLNAARSYITMFLVFAAILVFLLVGRAIFSGETHRGAVRVSFGGLGFLYKTFVQFWVPTALAISGILYRKARAENLPYRFPLLHVILTVLTLSMMGYKSGIIVGILPFLFIVISLLSLQRQLILGFSMVFVLIYYSSIIIGSGNGLGAVAQYLFLRGTEGTAWGLIASWELFETPHPNRLLSLAPILGARITAAILDIPRGSIEYLMLGSGQYITYLVHPNPSLVLAGETNLTITLAGEGIYLLGHKTFWILAFPVGLVTGFLCNNLQTFIRQNRLILAPLLAVIITNIILPLLNSGGLISLVSAFNVFYILSTFIFLKAFYFLLK